MIPVAELRNKHQGKAGAVRGGGPSLGKDLNILTQSSPDGGWSGIVISVNQHGLTRGWMDYTVFLDTWQELVKMSGIPEAEIRERSGYLVSRQPESDVDLGGSSWWQGRFSGQLACWLACWMGCNPVLLCGMDLYQNQVPAGEDPRNLAYQTPLEEHLQGWREAFWRCPHPERIRAVSGPLVEVFGEYERI
jgi:hypothetical protein